MVQIKRIENDDCQKGSVKQGKSQASNAIAIFTDRK